MKDLVIPIKTGVDLKILVQNTGLLQELRRISLDLIVEVEVTIQEKVLQTLNELLIFGYKMKKFFSLFLRLQN